MEIVFSPFQRPRFFTLTKPTPEEQTAFEENALKGLEHLIGDGKFAVGDKLTLADLSLISYLILVLEVRSLFREAACTVTSVFLFAAGTVSS